MEIPNLLAGPESIHTQKPSRPTQSHPTSRNAMAGLNMRNSDQRMATPPVNHSNGYSNPAPPNVSPGGPKSVAFELLYTSSPTQYRARWAPHLTL